jgi:hypothetical protein
MASSSGFAGCRWRWRIITRRRGGFAWCWWRWWCMRRRYGGFAWCWWRWWCMRRRCGGFAGWWRRWRVITRRRGGFAWCWWRWWCMRRRARLMHLLRATRWLERRRRIRSHTSPKSVAGGSVAAAAAVASVEPVALDGRARARRADDRRFDVALVHVVWRGRFVERRAPTNAPFGGAPILRRRQHAVRPRLSACTRAQVGARAPHLGSKASSAHHDSV